MLREDGGQSSTSWPSKKWAPTEQGRSKGRYSGWPKRDTRSNFGDYEDKQHHWEESAHDTKGVTTDVHEIVDVVEVEHDNSNSKASDKGAATFCAPNGEKAFAVTDEKLGDLFLLLKSRKGCVSATCKKNADVNTKEPLGCPGEGIPELRGCHEKDSS